MAVIITLDGAGVFFFLFKIQMVLVSDNGLILPFSRVPLDC
jgi:hypothetical protein